MYYPQKITGTTGTGTLLYAVLLYYADFQYCMKCVKTICFCVSVPVRVNCC